MAQCLPKTKSSSKKAGLSGHLVSTPIKLQKYEKCNLNVLPSGEQRPQSLGLSFGARKKKAREAKRNSINPK